MGDFATKLQEYNRWKSEVRSGPEDYEKWLELVDKAANWDDYTERVNVHVAREIDLGAP